MAIKTKWTPGVTMQLNQSKDAWEYINHAIGETTKISRVRLSTYVATAFEKLMFDLTPEEEADIISWESQTIKCATEDRFIRAGFSWREMERWTSDCYRISDEPGININPVSVIRNILSDLKIPVHYCATADDVLPSFFVTGLTCVRYMHLKNKPITLVASGTFEDLKREAASLERMLRIAGIRETDKRERVLRHP